MILRREGGLLQEGLLESLRKRDLGSGFSFYVSIWEGLL